jgi:serine protease inhibitor
MKRLLLLILTVTLLLGLAGCNSVEVRADRERVTDPEVSEAEVSALVDGNTGFAFDLYQELSNTDGNL